MGNPKTCFGLILTTCLSLLMARQAISKENPSAITATLESRYNSNIAKVSTNEQWDIDDSLSLGIDKSFESKRLSTQLNGFVQYHKFQRKTFSDDLQAQLSFNQKLDVITNRFSWTLNDGLHSVLTNPSLVDTPTNRELRNTFSTGPDFKYPLGSRTDISLSSRFDKTDFETLGDDSRKYTVSSELGRQLDKKLRIGLTYSWSKNRFDSGRTSKNNQVGMTVGRKINHGKVGGDISVSRVNSQDNNNSNSSAQSITWKLDFNRDLNKDASINGSFYRQLDDTNSTFDIPVSDLTLDLNQQETVKVTGVNLGYTNKLSGRSSIALSLFANKSLYLSTNSENRTIGSSFSLDHKLSSSTTSQSSISFKKNDFKPGNKQDHTYVLSTGINRTVLKSLSLGVAGSVEKRNGDTSVDSYSSWSLMMNVKYIIK